METTVFKKTFATVVLILLSLSVASATKDSILIDDFQQGLQKHWKIKRFKGETIYRVVNTETGNVLMAVSRASASGLIYEIVYDPKEYPILSWRWKVENIISKGNATVKEGDDYAARVYVVFPHWFPPKTKSINYIWANRIPKGTVIPNKFYSKAIMIAVESGKENTGKWIKEERNVYEDFRSFFGSEPPKAGAIAIMTDTDQTGEHAIAYYDDIVISKQ